MKLLIRLLMTAIVVFLLANFLPGMAVDSYWTAIIVAVVLGLLNLLVRPILVIFTFPITVLTLGFFLLVINALMILMCDALIEGFDVDGFWYALLFSLCLSIIQSMLFSVLD